MSTAVSDGSLYTTITTFIDDNRNSDTVTRVDNVIIGTISAITSSSTIKSLNDTRSDYTTNSSVMGNADLEDTNPRLVNGVVNLLLMLFNIGGNGLVIYVYHSLFRNTVFNLFVKALASLDLLTAVTTMLIDVIMKMRPNNEETLNTSVMCKLSHFQVYANSMASGCVLTLIAYQRYRKICQPLQRGMLLRRAKILLACICAFCLVLSIPTMFLYGDREIKVLVRNTVVHAIICRADQSYQDSHLNLVFYYVLMIAFCLVLGSTCVLYFMVSRSIRKFEKRTSAILNPPSPTTATTPQDPDTFDENEYRYDYEAGGFQRPSPATSRTVIMTSPVHGRNPAITNNNLNNLNNLYHHQQHRHMIRDPYHNRRAEGPHSSPHSAHHHQLLTNAGGGYARGARSVQTASPTGKQHNNGRANSSASQHQRKLSTFTMATSGNVISTQMYRVFSIITVVFIISYLPHLLALILTKVLDLDEKVLTHGQRIALEFAYNCPYIGTVSNPIIYGFSSSEFRDRVREMLQSCDVLCCCGSCCCCCCLEDGCRCPCCDPFDCCDEYACCNEE